MSTFVPRRVPRAGLDPIRDESTAIAVVLGAAHLPARDETIAMLLDDARRGVALVVVGGTPDPDAIVAVADRLLDPAVHGGRVSSAVVASIRRTPVDDPLTDADRWLEVDAIADDHGVDLVDWLVIDPGPAATIARPRELLGVPPRW